MPGSAENLPAAHRPGAGMRQRIVTTLAITALAGTLVAAEPPPPPSEGVATDACREALPDPEQPCDVVRATTHAGAALCRRSPESEACTPLNGQEVAESRLVEYEASDTHAILGIQRELQADLPLRHAVFPATHNSYNSHAYDPTLSRMDANQTYAMVDQLRMDVRRLELDVHWWFAADGSRVPVTCHATDEPNVLGDPVTRHTGCTTEDTVDVALVEIAAWLADHPDEVVMLRLETHLEGREGHDRVADLLDQHLGDRLYRPAGEGCRTLPLDLTTRQVRAAGAQVVAIGGCGDGSPGWHGAVFDDDSLRVESQHRGGFSFPSCGDVARRSAEGSPSYETHWIRFFEDATLVSSLAATGGTGPARVTPAVAREWTRCGVNQPSFDHLTPTDGRLAELVWSFADGEQDAPRGDCAVQADDGRFHSSDCRTHQRFVCSAASTYTVTDRAGPWHAGHDACEAEGRGSYTTPRTGYQAEQVTGAREAAGADRAWLSVRRVDGAWHLGCRPGGQAAGDGPRQGPPVRCPG